MTLSLSLVFGDSLTGKLALIKFIFSTDILVRGRYLMWWGQQRDRHSDRQTDRQLGSQVGRKVAWMVRVQGK